MKYLKIKGLSKGYHDPVEVLLHASFQVMVDFVEKEKPGEINWESDKGHSKAWKEVTELYKWYTKTRPNRKDPLDNPKLKHPALKTKRIPNTDLYQMLDYDHKKYKAYAKALKEYVKLDIEWGKEDQTNLHRLIDVRKFLWT